MITSFNKNIKLLTPWGHADYIKHIAPGIIFVSTPSHGGYKVERDVLRTMPKKYRVGGGWYEEDCEAVKVVLAFPKYFSPDHVEAAKESYAYWFKSDGTYEPR